MAAVYLFWAVLYLFICQDQLLSVDVYPVYNFSKVEDVVVNRCIPVSRTFPVLSPCSGLFTLDCHALTVLHGPPFHASCSSNRWRVTLLLLLIAGFEVNPGPHRSGLQFGVFNAGGANQKAAGLEDIIFD